MKKLFVISCVFFILSCQTTDLEDSTDQKFASNDLCAQKNIDSVVQHVKSLIVEIEHFKLKEEQVSKFVSAYNSIPPKTSFEIDRLDYFISASEPRLIGVLFSNNNCFIGEQVFPTMLFYMLLNNVVPTIKDINNAKPRTEIVL